MFYNNQVTQGNQFMQNAFYKHSNLVTANPRIHAAGQ